LSFIVPRLLHEVKAGHWIEAPAGAVLGVAPELS
jgi:hypothetical protein